MRARLLIATLLAVASVVIAAGPAVADPETVETTITVTADPTDPSSVVLGAALSGPYVDGGGSIPAGTWSFLVVDNDSAATYFSRELAQPQGGPTSVEVVWSDVPAGVTVSAVVMYQPDEPSEQLAFAGASSAFTSAGAAKEQTTMRESGDDPAAMQKGADAPPVWLGILLAAVSLLVAAIGIVILVRRDRRSAVSRT